MCTCTEIHTFSDYWLRTSAVIQVYKARARRNGYKMFISVYILCHRFAIHLGDEERAGGELNPFKPNEFPTFIKRTSSFPF